MNFLSQGGDRRVRGDVPPALLPHVETGLPRTTRLAPEVAALCDRIQPEAGHTSLLKAVNNLTESQHFEHRLTRGGWYRLGGVMAPGGKRVTEEISDWAERESDGDVTRLMARHRDEGLVATRVVGRTHYFVASVGTGPLDFLQLEVEELQEVQDHPLLPPGYAPGNLAELVDPAECPRLPPDPVGPPRYAFRRLFCGKVLLAELKTEHGNLVPLARFAEDWRNSSAGEFAILSDHWVLSVQETRNRYGEPNLIARPVPVDKEVPNLQIAVPPRGAELADLIRTFDQQTGYTFAWYFWMLTSRRVPHTLVEAVQQESLRIDDWLPAKDLKVLQAWNRQPYCV